MQVEPQLPRFSIEPIPGGIRAVVPARRNWFVLLFLCAWLVGWAVGEISVLGQLLKPSDKTNILFLSAWIVGWTFGGITAAGTVLWQLVGREVIAINSNTLEHRIEAFGIGRSRSYRVGEIKSLRAVAYPHDGTGKRAAGNSPTLNSGFGPVAFDYGARTIYLAPALDEPEAQQLVEKLAARLPWSP